ncbi:hypothetical protein AgCh_004189 [Apium graveolens]
MFAVEDWRCRYEEAEKEAEKGLTLLLEWGSPGDKRIDASFNVVAVKQLGINGSQGNREFLAEIFTLSIVHHPNLVNLLGYYADGQQRILVYKYMPNGSLENHLVGGVGGVRTPGTCSPANPTVFRRRAGKLQFSTPTFENDAVRFVVRPYNGQVRPMWALDPVVRAMMCALLGLKRNQLVKRIPSPARELGVLVEKAELVGFFWNNLTEMADSFIPVSADHSEPSVGAPASDPRPVIPPALAILPPPVLQPVPLQAIPPPGMRPPVRGPPPADSDSTGHSIRELQHIIRTTYVDRGVRELREKIHVTQRVLEARLHGATLPGRGPDALLGWATEVMKDFERLAGPEFPWS